MASTDARPRASTPPTASSDEAKPHQHRLAQEQGDTYVTAVKHMAETVADFGTEARAGDMVVALAIEDAEGMYRMHNGELVWQEPEAENAHFEISVRDAADNRFVPGLGVEIRVLAEDGTELVSTTLPLLWHPWLYHYGANLDLPEDTTTVIVECSITAPTFPRHDEKNGKRYAEDVFVRFEDVKLPS